jgi:hypothetical protein
VFEAKLTPAVHQPQLLAVPFADVNFPIGQDTHSVTPAAVLYRPGPQAVQAEKPVAEVYTPEAHPAHAADETLPAAVE